MSRFLLPFTRRVARHADSPAAAAAAAAAGRKTIQRTSGGVQTNAEKSASARLVISISSANAGRISAWTAHDGYTG